MHATILINRNRRVSEFPKGFFVAVLVYLGVTLRISLGSLTVAAIDVTNKCQPFMNDDLSDVVVDTVIVGAGGTGLFAGYTLRRNGHEDFKILEASSKIGGRLRDVPRDFTGDDLRLGFGPVFAFNGLDPLRDVLLLDNDDEWEMETITPKPETSESCEIAENGVATCDDIETEEYGEEVFADGGTFFSYLEKYVIPHVEDKIVLETSVTAINYDDGGDLVAVCTTGGKPAYRAKNVVFAVPLGVLQDEDIDFYPPLPSLYRETIDSIPIIGGLRFWVEFSERFFSDSLEVGREGSFGTYYFNALFGDEGRNIVTNVGIDEVELAALSDDEVIELVLDDLDRIYNGKARETYVQHMVQNWSTDPQIRGVFSDDVGVDTDYGVFAEPIDGRIYIAGEFAIEARYFYFSGRNAAEMILEGYNKKCNEKEGDKFFLRVKRNAQGDIVRVVKKSCKWLSKRNSKRKKKICKRKTGDKENALLPAKEVCPVTCSTC